MTCPNCNSPLELKKGVKKLCAQIGNPDIAIVETTDPYFCKECIEYFLPTKEIISIISQVNDMQKDKKIIEKGVYS